MPFYDFYCSENHTVYTFFARSVRLAGKVPRCPDDASFSLRRIASPFSVSRKRSEPTGSESANLEDPALERALSSLEGEFSSLDSDNPNPRDLGRLMREMTRVAGEPIGDEMEEVIGRLEKGEDPEKIEEEFGDALDQAFECNEGEGEISGDLLARARNRIHRRSRPRRDNRVYAMEEYLD